MAAATKLSKLEYLNKYLAKPGEATEKRQPTNVAATYCPDAARPHKEKKKRKKGSTAYDPNNIRIRDMSEILPQARELDGPMYAGKQAKLLSLNLDDDEARLARDGELDFVEPEAVIEASKIDVEKSGQKWQIQNHSKKPNKQALRAPLKETKAEVVKEEKDGGASDSDFSPARPSARGRADLSPARRPAAAKTMSRRPATAQDDDMSPPRQSAASTAAAAKSRHDSDADLSPPRAGGAPSGGSQRLRHDSDADMSPPRQAAPAKRERHDSDADMSPPRRGKPEVKQEADLSPPRGKPASKEADADLSPPRGRAAASAPKKTRHDSDADISPPRKEAPTKARHDSDADISPPRRDAPKKARHDSDADISPPRRDAPKKKRHDSDADISPPRRDAPKKKRHDSDADISPPRRDAPKKARHDSDADISPLRRGGKARHDSDADLSPPRHGSKADDDDPELMSSGLRAGIISGNALKEQASKVREDRQAALAAAPDHETGRGAETVYRSRQGGTVDRAQWIEEKTKKRKKKMSEYPEQELAWGGGLKQQSNADEEREETTRVSQLPFARFEPEESAIKALQDRQSWNDPMSKFDAQEAEAAAYAGASAAAPAVKKPKCPHPPWPNRFGIPPGYRWDGAVRGLGYEKRWLEAKNNRAFTKTEKYKWERLED